MSKVDSRAEGEGLPAFLSDEAPGANDTETSEGEVIESGPDGSESSQHQEGPEYHEDPGEGDYAEDEAEAASYRPRSTYRPRRQRRPSRSPSGGGMTFSVAAACLVLATVFAIIPNAVPAQLTALGLTTGAFVLTGIALFSLGVLFRRVARMQAELSTRGEQADQSGGVDDEMREQLAVLVENTSDEARGDTFENVQQAHLLLQRLDEKVNNLTRATKMYGKPLVDIANNCTELGASVSGLRTTVETGHDSLRASQSDIGKQLSANAEAMPSFQPLQEQLSKLDVAIQAMTQRLEDSEVRKILMHLEDTQTKTQEQLQLLLRGESIDTAANRLQTQLEDSTTKLTQGLGQLRDGNLGDLEVSVRDIQREVASVATSVSQIQAAVKSGARPAAAAPRGPVTTTAPAASTPTTTGTPTPTMPEAEDGDGEGGGYQTGARRSKSKNVLGAIAKLKQMKG